MQDATDTTQPDNLFNKLFNEQTPLSTYHSDVWRAVESQEHSATLNLVDDLDEQSLLESLLDESKPRYRQGTEEMHYLFKTAFRYPPLHWGSRFGTQQMPSYYYASEELETALSECAYYRFVFLADMVEPYSKPIQSQYELIKAEVSSEHCLDLTDARYDGIQNQLLATASYELSQKIGAWAVDEKRKTKLDVIRFESARASDKGINIAIANPSAINSKRPSEQLRCLCLTKTDSISFSSRQGEFRFVFNYSDFCDSTGKLARLS